MAAVAGWGEEFVEEVSAVHADFDAVQPAGLTARGGVGEILGDPGDVELLGGPGEGTVRGLAGAARDLRPVARAINLCGGEVTNQAVAETFDLTYSPRYKVA